MFECLNRKSQIKNIVIFCFLFLFGCGNNLFSYYDGEAPALPVVHEIMNETIGVYDGISIGTGTIFKKTNQKTYILTCAHVISPRDFKFETVFDDFTFKISMMNLDSPLFINKEFLKSIKKPILIKKSKWIGGIQYLHVRTANIFVIDRMNDICILKIIGNFPGQEIKIYKQTVPNGTEIYHVGNLLGYMDYSVLSGIVSHNSRGLFGEKIQVDMRATFGCSGGGVFTKDKGEYIGMVAEKSKLSDATIIISAKKIIQWMKAYEIEKNF